MVNPRTLWARATEGEHSILLFGAFCVTLGALIVAQSFFSPGAVLTCVLGIAFLILSVLRPTWTIAFLAVFLPFEPFLLKFIPDDIYVFARYFSEVLVYLLALVTLWRVVSGKIKRVPTPIDVPMVFFLIILLASTLINSVPVSIALLGARQILRFILLYYIVIHLAPPTVFLRRLTYVLFGIAVFQSLLGLAQVVFGAPLDQFLLPAEMRTFGDITLTEGVEQFWDPGSRVFATLGRYDRLGNFLYLFLLFGVGLLYEPTVRKHRKELWWLFALGVPALLLTFSRASWFGFLLGFLFIAIAIRRDRRVMTAFLSFLLVAIGYLGLSGLNVRFITETSGQTLVERFYETFSYARWRGEYYGLGRVFWLVQTPLAVIPASPLFGFGPGQFGGGAAAALGNARVYEQLGLPFGVFGTGGYIDNNWFSLWGETGTLGIVFYVWMFIALFRTAIRTYRVSPDPFTRAMAIGFAAILIAVSFNAWLSTILEIRTTAFYLWLYGGIVFLLERRKQETANRL